MRLRGGQRDGAHSDRVAVMARWRPSAVPPAAGADYSMLFFVGLADFKGTSTSVLE